MYCSRLTECRENLTESWETNYMHKKSIKLKIDPNKLSGKYVNEFVQTVNI